MNRIKIYLDTSILSFYYADDSIDFRNVTIDFFNNYSHSYDIYISDIVLLEISKNKDNVKKANLLKLISDYSIKKLNSNPEINQIAQKYIENGVIPPKKVEDALHIAFATYYEIDILLSWNFKHLSNIRKEYKVIIENLKLGYHYPLRLLSPLEVLDENE